jgi:hypothetical protein
MHAVAGDGVDAHMGDCSRVCSVLDTTKPFPAEAPPPLRGPFWEEVFIYAQH